MTNGMDSNPGRLKEKLTRLRQAAYGTRGRIAALLLTGFLAVSLLTSWAAIGWFQYQILFTRNRLPAPSPAFILGWFAFVLAFWTLSFSLIAYYLGHIFSNKTLSQLRQALWSAGILFVFPFVALIYWFLYMRQSGRQEPTGN